MVYVFEWTDKIFPNSAKAIRYYKAATKWNTLPFHILS
jgi:hypothetical protein